LVEALWGHWPPPSALVTVRNYVMRLRRTLGDAGADRIRTHSPGYRMCVDARELDVSRFEALAESAKKAAASGSWQAAVSQAAQALALWRGEPLADVESEALALREVPRLRELRVQAAETRIEAELQLGGHGEVIAELCRLVATQPLREHLRALLMCALYRSGRQADALAAYQDARDILVNEVGAEPGPEMRELHQRILAADPTLDWQPPAQDSATVTAPAELPGQAGDAVPRQLPAAVRHFTGRQDELQALTNMLDQDGTGTVVISAIDGMAGIGKTALAIQAAHRLSGQFPGGQLFIDLHGYTKGRPPREPGQALEAFLRALGVPGGQVPQEVEECAALYRQRLAGTRTLILLDNASDEAQVRPLLPGEPGCLVLVTSRRRLKGLDDARSLALDLLPPRNAVALLRAVAGAGRIAAGDPLLGEIAGLCGRLPLALRIGGALLRHRPAWSLGHLAGLLRDQHRVRALSDGERDLAAVFDLSYAGLDEPRRLLFRRLGLVPGPDADAHAAAALLECDPDGATALLEDLVDHNLLTEHALGRYRLHDLLRAHARTLAEADPAERSREALDRLLRYYAHTAQRASIPIARAPRPEPDGPAPPHAPALQDPEAARAWLRTEYPNLEAAFTHARTGTPALDEHITALAAGLAEILLSDGPWTRALEIHQAAAEVAGHRRQPAAHATALTDLGRVRHLTGDLAGAADALVRALETCREAGSRDGEAHALTSLGQVRHQTGDLAGAADALVRALEISRETGNRLSEAWVLAILGQVRHRTGDLAGAADALVRALETCRETGNRNSEAWALNHYAATLAALGERSRALALYQQALAMNRELTKPDDEAIALEGLGECHLATSEDELAAAHLKQALDIFQRLGMAPDAQRVRNRLADLGITLGA
jgi:DNA-binding SARP family transcriptional activator/tetratricopeptide (TPR) repeat protein